MQIFIAWSKGVSEKIGKALTTWLRELNEPVFRTIISDENIPVGDLWNNALDTALKRADYGILCVTEENLTSPWLCYESGALRMSTAGNVKSGQPGVAPVLFGDVTNSQIASPLQHFQSVKFDKDGMWKLVLELHTRSAYTNSNNHLDEKDIMAKFESAYPALETQVQDILRNGIPAAQERSKKLEGKLDETLALLQELLTERMPSVGQERKDAPEVELPTIEQEHGDKSYSELMDDLGKTLESLLEQSKETDIAETVDNAIGGTFSPKLEELNAALTEFQSYERSGKAFKTLSMMGNFLSDSIRKEGLNESNHLRVQQYRELLQRSQSMAETPAQSRVLQRLLNALSALL